MKSKITIVSQFCVLPLMVAALSIAGVVMEQDSPAARSSSLSVKDKAFMKKAAKGGMMEVAKPLSPLHGPRNPGLRHTFLTG